MLGEDGGGRGREGAGLLERGNGKRDGEGGGRNNTEG